MRGSHVDEPRIEKKIIELQNQLEEVLWDSSVSINDLKRAKVELEREIEHRTNLEEELRLAQKLESIGQLAAGIAHEINTPMQYIGDNISFLGKAFSQLLSIVDAQQEALNEHLAGWKAPNDAKLAFVRKRVPKAIRSAEEGVAIVSRIVRAMKDMSHTDGEEMSSLDVNSAVNTAVTVSKGEWKYVATIDTNLDERIPEIMGYPGELKQVLINMIVNAAHAIEEAKREGGRIQITTSSTDAVVEVTITDNGAGIPPEIRHRIFDHFFTTKDVGKGTGQGLSLAHRVVTQRHSGELSLESEVGVGTTFRIRLPLLARSIS